MKTEEFKSKYGCLIVPAGILLLFIVIFFFKSIHSHVKDYLIFNAKKSEYAIIEKEHHSVVSAYDYVNHTDQFVFLDDSRVNISEYKGLKKGDSILRYYYEDLNKKKHFYYPKTNREQPAAPSRKKAIVYLVLFQILFFVPSFFIVRKYFLDFSVEEDDDKENRTKFFRTVKKTSRLLSYSVPILVGLLIAIISFSSAISDLTFIDKVTVEASALIIGLKFIFASLILLIVLKLRKPLNNKKKTAYWLFRIVLVLLLISQLFLFLYEWFHTNDVHKTSLVQVTKSVIGILFKGLK